MPTCKNHYQLRKRTKFCERIGASLLGGLCRFLKPENQNDGWVSQVCWLFLSVVDLMSSWWNVKLMKCQVDEMSSWWNVKLMKCQVDEMSSWQNVKLSKCQVVKMSSWQNVKVTKCQVDKMSSWGNVKLRKCQSDKMSSWQNVKLTKCQVDKMSSWQNVKLTKCQVDKMSSWQNVHLNNVQWIPIIKKSYLTIKVLNKQLNFFLNRHPGCKVVTVVAGLSSATGRLDVNPISVEMMEPKCCAVPTWPGSPIIQHHFSAKCQP